MDDPLIVAAALAHIAKPRSLDEMPPVPGLRIYHNNDDLLLTPEQLAEGAITEERR